LGAGFAATLGSGPGVIGAETNGIVRIGRTLSSRAPGATKTHKSSASETCAVRINTSSELHSSSRTSRSAGVIGTSPGGHVSTWNPRERNCIVSSSDSSTESVIIRASGMKPQMIRKRNEDVDIKMPTAVRSLGTASPVYSKAIQLARGFQVCKQLQYFND